MILLFVMLLKMFGRHNKVLLEDILWTSSSKFYLISTIYSNYNGYYELKWSNSNLPKSTLHYWCFESICSSSTKKFPELANKLNLRRIQDTFMNRLIVELQDISHGANKYRASVKDTREYKDYIILFMVPRESGVSSEIVNQLKSCLYNIFNSEHFFILMETFLYLMNKCFQNTNNVKCF